MGDYFVASLETIIKTVLKATDPSRFMSIMYNRFSWKMEEEDIYKKNAINERCPESLTIRYSKSQFLSFGNTLYSLVPINEIDFEKLKSYLSSHTNFKTVYLLGAHLPSKKHDMLYSNIDRKDRSIFNLSCINDEVFTNAFVHAAINNIFGFALNNNIKLVLIGSDRRSLYEYFNSPHGTKYFELTYKNYDIYIFMNIIADYGPTIIVKPEYTGEVHNFTRYRNSRTELILNNYLMTVRRGYFRR